MSHLDWNDVAIIFWIFVIIVTVTPMILSFLKRRETERTIRLAIEKGQTLEPEVLARLLKPQAAPEETSPHSVRFGGIVTLAAAAGLLVFGLFTGGRFFHGIAGLVACVGIGLIIGARFLPDPREDERSPKR
jgi:hypothetical protein